jgi:hypothetical protein
MAMPASGPAQAAEPKPLHPLIDVFFAPGAAMDALAERPRFLLALVLITAIGAAATAIAFERGVIEHGIRQKLENDPRFERLPAERRSAIVDRAASIASYAAAAASLLGPAILAMAASGLFLLLTKLTGCDSAGFRHMMAVVAHGWLPLALANLIGIPVLLAKDPESIDFQNVLPMANLGFLFSPTDQHKLYAVGSSIDLFSFWAIWLMALGIARLTKKGVGRALAMVAVPWALYVAVFKALLG